jgi:hypothetical protein
MNNLIGTKNQSLLLTLAKTGRGSRLIRGERKKACMDLFAGSKYFHMLMMYCT